MISAFSRFAFGLLVLVACAVAAWHGAEPPPTREVVELVSVMYKPARVPSVATVQFANVESEKVQPTAQSVAPSAEKTFTSSPSPKRLADGRAAQHAKAVPRQRPLVIPVRHTAEAEPPLPAIFVPIRSLGLYLQFRLGVAPEELAGPAGKRKRKPPPA